MGKKAFGSYVATLRDAKGLTQAQAAAAIAAHLPSKKLVTRMVTYYEAGENFPGVDVLLGILKVLGGTLEDATYLMLGTFADETDEGRAKADAWLASAKEEGAWGLSATEAARIVAGLEASGETDLASDYLNIGRRLLRGREAKKRRADEGS